MPRPDWTWVRGLGNSLPSKISLLIPVLGFLIVQDEKLVAWLNGRLDILTTHRCDLCNFVYVEAVIKLKIFFLYFGALAFGLASTIYQMRCPSLIKLFPDADTFFQNRTESTTRRDLMIIIDELESFRTYPIKASAIDIEIARSSLLLDAGESAEWLAVKADLMKSYYRFHDANRISSISFTLALYLISIILFAVPSVATAIKVAAVFFARIVQTV